MLNLQVHILSLRNVGGYSQIVRIIPAGDKRLPVYEAGQHATFVRQPDGAEKTFSMASSPAETQTGGYLEFYISADVTPQPDGVEGIHFFFNPETAGEFYHLREIGGSFTLNEQVTGYRHIVMVATGSGLAPFRSMIRALSERPARGRTGLDRMSLLYGHRTIEELAYYPDITSIEREKTFDFFALPTVTRRTEGLTAHPDIPVGRVVGFLAEALSSRTAGVKSTDNSHEAPMRRFSQRMKLETTLLMVCGNPGMVEEVHRLAAMHGIHCVSEEW